MGTAFKKALIVFIGFIIVLGVVLIGVILQNFSEYESLTGSDADGRFFGDAGSSSWERVF